LTGLSRRDADYRYFELCFGLRAAEELYDVTKDPDCVNNLAGDPNHAANKKMLRAQMEAELTAQGDPRILGRGDIFDFYPNCRIDRQQKLYGNPDYDPLKLFEAKYGEK
jgi:hypothetical protein